MERALTVIFFEDYFVCSIFPNNNAWEPLKINCSEKNLLYFYVNGSDVRNDEFAKERYEADPNSAYGDFYELIINNTKKFRKFDLELEPVHLLKDLIEQIKSAYAERIMLFIPELNINDNIPLNICFIPGINRDVQELITNYFLLEGFKLNNKADYFESFLKILHLKGIISSKINLSIIETYFGDLLFHYIEYNDKIIKKESENLIGKGIDYRTGNLAKLMVEKAARQTSSSLLNDPKLLENEIKKFHRKAVKEINNFEYKELEVKIELSDYTSARVIIDERELEKMSSESFQFFRFKYESFISKHSNLTRTEKIILNGDVLSSVTFLQFFQNVFGGNKVIKPYTNFIELLSRGIFENASQNNWENILPNKNVITITVETNTPAQPTNNSKTIINIATPNIKNEKISVDDKKILPIGIDLGTTFCCVACIIDGVLQVIPDNRGRETTPSVIWFDGKTSYVGEEANKKKITVFAPIYEFFKRDMGKPTKDTTGTKETAPYEVSGIKYGAIGISAILLRKLKRDAWQYFKKKKIIDASVKESDFKIDAVITVPAYFGDEERNATKYAGELAGLNVVGIINEPTAASLTYGISLEDNKKIMVFDLGGGTLDVTILEIIKGDFFKVIASDGNVQLGGKDWDDVLIEYLKGKFKAETNSEIPDDRFYDLQQLAIQAKKDLSEEEETTVYLSSNGFDLEIKLYRSEQNNKNEICNNEGLFYFDEHCSELVSRCLSRCNTVLEKSKLTWSDIDEIVLAGGSCRMPMIHEMLEKVSNKKIGKNNEGFNYDTAIACGAAKLGQIKGKIQDITSKSIGIKLVNSQQREFIDHLIYKNSPLPVKVRKQYLTDPYAILEIFEGESKEPIECIPLGMLELENTGDRAIIILEIDENGILKVLADYQPEGIKETKINGSSDFPEDLREHIQGITIIS